jgi:uncharacterized membrane protein
MIEEYLIYFFVFSFIGWIFENLIGKYNSFCGDNTIKKLKLCLPLLTIYGLGGMILLFIKKNIIKNNIISFSFVSGVILSVLECIAGQASLYINKRKTWNYNYLPITLCDGYVALPVFFVWIIFSGIFFKVHDKFNYSKI